MFIIIFTKQLIITFGLLKMYDNVKNKLVNNKYIFLYLSEF